MVSSGKVLVTGSNGFVGSALCRLLREQGIPYAGAIRQRSNETEAASTSVVVGDIDAGTDWQQALTDCESVVHLAARVHVMHELAADALSAYRQVNTDGTMNLARQAVQAGVRRFIYLSSIKVNGEQTADQPFTEADLPAPADPYGVSKLTAERQLKVLADETGLELVIIRPPLVYGPGVKANFLALMRLVHKGWPLPLGSINNRRSLLALANLTDFIRHCLSEPQAAGQTFLLCDGEAVSTPELVRSMARHLHRPARLWLVPVMLLRFVGSLAGRQAQVSRLTESLQLDCSHARQQLGWEPPLNFEQAMAETVAWYLHRDDRP